MHEFRLAPAPGRDAGPDADSRAHAARRAWAALVPHSARIADEISVALLTRPALDWTERTPHFAADLRAATRKHVRAGVRTLAGIAAVDSRAVDVWREFGCEQARKQVPLERILNSYIIGNRVLWDALVRHHREGVHPPTVDEGTLLVAANMLWSAMDVQNAIMVSTYRTESERLRRLDDGRRTRALAGLIDGRGSDPTFAREACADLGISAGSRITCVVGLGDAAAALLEQHDGGLRHADITTHWQVKSGHTVGLVAHPMHTVDQLCAMLRQQCSGRVAVMTSADGVEGFATAYRLATQAVETTPEGADDVVKAGERVPEILLAASPEATQHLVQDVLGQVMTQPEHQREVLLATLDAYLDGGLSPTRAAEMLTCHRNTVIYRMNHLAELTPYDPHRPADLLLLTLALKAVRGGCAVRQ